MKIIDVIPIHVRMPAFDKPCVWGDDAFLVKVVTDEGLVGWGASDTNPAVAKAVVDAPCSNFYSVGLKQLLIGEDPLEIQKLWDKMYFFSNYFGRRGVAIHALSAIDIALWDIASQFYGVPISKLLGGKRRDRVRVYATLDDRTFSDEEGIENVLRLKEKGFTCVKVSGKSDFKHEHDRLVKYRKAVGDNFELSIDLMSTWRTYGVAAEMFKSLEEVNLNWIEEPVLADDTDAYAKLQGLTSAKVAGGESLTTRWEFSNFIKMAHPDIIQPDITRCGGISELRKIYDMASIAGIELVPHDYSTAILISATAQFLASVEAEPLFEYCMSNSKIFTDIAPNYIKLDNDGYITVPDCLGLGLEIDEDFIKAHEII